MSQPDDPSRKEARIVEARMRLRERFEARQAATPARADTAPEGTGPANRHGMPRLPPGQYELAGLLSQLDLGDEIPETLYLCVAQIIAFAYRLRGRVPQDWNPAGNNMAGSETPASEQTLALPPALS